jgi:pseudaminic acid synthase
MRPLTSPAIRIGDQTIGPGHPTYIVAELAANHGGRLENAIRLIEAAADAGADAVKLQTSTADTMTLRSEAEAFRIQVGSAWDGKTLYELYDEAHTPWPWHAQLQRAASARGLSLFSSAFDDTAVTFLETLDVPAFKVSSFEIVDLPLIRRIARTGKPLILSTGMATLPEISEAIEAARGAGASAIALLKCTSAYPAAPRDVNLRAIPHLAAVFQTPVGLSDHTIGAGVPIAAVALGASILEKHLTLSRSMPTAESSFASEPAEFKAMVDGIRMTEQALGTATDGPAPGEASNVMFRRSLFVVADVKQGQVFDRTNLRAIRPGHGLHPRHFTDILGRRAACDVSRGTPLAWEMID